MTKIVAPSVRQVKIVIFSDLCSSTLILEDLLRSESQKRWRDVLIALKDFLRAESASLTFDIYKFIGDGWVLLLGPDADPPSIFAFLRRFCNEYERLFQTHIEPALSTRIEPIGISFGMDKGTLVRMIMNSQVEYIGRPLNVASRLQAAIKDKDPNAQGKVMMTRSLYADISATLDGKYRVDNADRELRNISGGDAYRCRKLWLFKKGK